MLTFIVIVAFFLPRGNLAHQFGFFIRALPLGQVRAPLPARLRKSAEEAPCLLREVTETNDHFGQVSEGRLLKQCVWLNIRYCNIPFQGESESAVQQLAGRTATRLTLPLKVFYTTILSL